MPTICAQCKFLHAYAKQDAWWKWLCTKAPIAPHYNFVVGKEMADPPYAYCRTINRDGHCEEYEEGTNCLSPDKFTPARR